MNILSGFAVLQRAQVRRPVAAISMARCPRRGAQQVLRLSPRGVRGHSASRVVRSQAGQVIKRSARCRARSAAASISLCREGVMCFPHRLWWHDLHVEFGRPLLWLKSAIAFRSPQEVQPATPATRSTRSLYASLRAAAMPPLMRAERSEQAIAGCRGRTQRRLCALRFAVRRPLACVARQQGLPPSFAPKPHSEP